MLALPRARDCNKAPRAHLAPRRTLPARGPFPARSRRTPRAASPMRAAAPRAPRAPRVAAAALLLLALALAAPAPAAAKITDATLQKDARVLVPLDEPFGFGADGRINVTVSKFVVRPLVDPASKKAPAGQPSLGRMGVLLTTPYGELQLERAVKEGACPLDSDDQVTLFTFDSLDAASGGVEEDYILGELLEDYVGGRCSWRWFLALDSLSFFPILNPPILNPNPPTTHPTTQAASSSSSSQTASPTRPSTSTSASRSSTRRARAPTTCPSARTRCRPSTCSRLPSSRPRARRGRRSSRAAAPRRTRSTT